MVRCSGGNNLELEQLFSSVCSVCLLNNRFPLPLGLLLGHRERVGMMFIMEARGTWSGHHTGLCCWLVTECWKAWAGAVGIVWLCSLCVGNLEGWRLRWEPPSCPGSIPLVCHTDAKAPGAFGNVLCIGLWCHTYLQQSGTIWLLFLPRENWIQFLVSF